MGDFQSQLAPFDKGKLKQKGDVHRVRPELVAEVGVTEWTNDNKLRHPKYIGLRDDKEAENVHKERN